VAEPKPRLELLAEAAHAALGDSSIKLLFGRKHLTDHEQRRRIVWLHAPSSIAKPDRTGHTLVGTDVNGQRMRAAWMRSENAEIHIFAEDAGKLDAPNTGLFDRFLVALEEADPRVQFNGYSWPSDAPQEAGHTQRQPWIRLLASFRFPVTDQRNQLVVVTAETHECGIITDIEAPFPPTTPFPDEE
jgi:hypothetical protein